jgi:hypothetical protein
MQGQPDAAPDQQFSPNVKKGTDLPSMDTCAARYGAEKPETNVASRRYSIPADAACSGGSVPGLRGRVRFLPDHGLETLHRPCVANVHAFFPLQFSLPGRRGHSCETVSANGIGCAIAIGSVNEFRTGGKCRCHCSYSSSLMFLRIPVFVSKVTGPIPGSKQSFSKFVSLP